MTYIITKQDFGQF